MPQKYLVKNTLEHMNFDEKVASKIDSMLAKSDTFPRKVAERKRLKRVQKLLLVILGTCVCVIAALVWLNLQPQAPMLVQFDY